MKDHTERMAWLAQKAEEAQQKLKTKGEDNCLDEKSNAIFERNERLNLLPDRHPQRDFFICDFLDYKLKDDLVSMEAPLFTLSTKPDLSTWKWTSQDGNRYVEVYPSVKGRATMFDKDVLIYVISQMTAGLNEKRTDAKSRTVRFTVYDYLVATNKATGNTEYKNLKKAFERLRGTSITTDIRTGGKRVQSGFGIIDKWNIVEKSNIDERMVAVEVTLSDWLYNAVQAHEVLTINPNYFRLRKPLERRLYEIARKHCGKESSFNICLETLKEKTGSKSILKMFKHSLKVIEKDGDLLDFKVSLDDKNMVTFTKNLPQPPNSEK